MADEPEVEEIDTLHDDLSAAFDALETGGAEPAAKTSPTPAAEEQAGAAEPAGGPARDQAGRFAPKADAPGPLAQTAAPASAAITDGERIPAALSATIKANWASLSPEVRAEFLRRETDFDKGKAAFESKAQLANRIEELFAPRMDRLNTAGVTREQAVQQLLAAQDWLERDPRAALLHLAQSYGIHPSQLGQPNGHQQAAPQAQPQLPPYLQPLLRDVASLKQTVTQQNQAAARAAQAQITDAIQQFAADPKHLYYENVRGQMAALLSAGQAKDMADAYEQAIWSSPEIRPLLLKQQQAEAQAAARAANGAKVTQARLAGGSVTGSPTQGSSPSSKTNPSSSLSDDISSAWDELVGA